MKASPCVLVVTWVLLCSVTVAGRAHPGSGIVVDEQARVWFMDTGFGLWQIDAGGRLTAHGGPGGHFLALDRQGRFQHGHFSALEPGDVEISRLDPTLLVGTSYPLAIGADGAMYFPRRAGPGRVALMRMPPGEAPQKFADLPPARETSFEGKSVDAEWVWGLAAGPAGSLYYTEKHAVRRIAADGTVSTVAENIAVPDCEHPPIIKNSHVEPGLYGLDVAADGTVYVAASACSALLKIAPDGAVSVALRATNRWTPQGVAIHGDALFVLEYDYVDSDDRADWMPRVRRLDRDGMVAIVAVVEQRPRKANSKSKDAGADFAGTTAGQERSAQGIKICWCPPGAFTFGSPRSEPERRPGENQVTVTLSRGYWMGKYEVTQGDWKRIVGKLPGEFTAELPEDDELPVGNVNFSEAEMFCAQLTEKARQADELPAGWEFRLPTEAQWEYACRAGTTTATAFGNSIDSRNANFLGDKPYNGGEPGPALRRATKVGSYPANPWGLCDMHGNTCEWCRDWFHIRYPGGVDPDLRDARATATPSENGDYSRARRGGTWTDPGWPQRCAFRQRFEPERRYDHIGFRVALVQK